MIQAIISDLDGTILPKGGKISPENLAAFQKTGQKGIQRIIATGRNLYSALQALPPGFPIDYLIFSSGAGILKWPDRQMLFTRHLSRQTAQEIACYLWDYNINFTIQQAIPDNHHFYYTSIYPLHEDYKRRLAAYAPFGIPICSPDDIQSEATQFVMILDASQIHLLEKIRKDLASYSVVRSTSPIDAKAVWIEIFAPGINKGTACLRLLKQLDIHPEDCAGLGNDYNDVDFLDLCGTAFLVGNAPFRLKPYYKSVASDRNNGFAEFIDRVLIS